MSGLFTFFWNGAWFHPLTVTGNTWLVIFHPFVQVGGIGQFFNRHLHKISITEEFCGCPIRTNMETVIVDHTAECVPVHFARDATEANHVFVVNRVKPHTRLEGEFQKQFGKHKIDAIRAFGK